MTRLLLIMLVMCVAVHAPSQIEYFVSPLDIEMVFVQGGTFNMLESNSIMIISVEKPEHQVTLDSFYISKQEITQKQFATVMGYNPNKIYWEFLSQDSSMIKEEIVNDSLSVGFVSWLSSVIFCNRLSLIEGLQPVYSMKGVSDPDLWKVPTSRVCPSLKRIAVNWEADGYRLPTNAEWEFAARGGLESAEMLFSEIYTPNELGFVIGEQWEWCWNWDGSYTGEPKTNPRGPKKGTFRVLRIGKWFDWLPTDVEPSHYSTGDYPLVSYGWLGFRVVRNHP